MNHLRRVISYGIFLTFSLVFSSLFFSSSVGATPITRVSDSAPQMLNSEFLDVIQDKHDTSPSACSTKFFTWRDNPSFRYIATSDNVSNPTINIFYSEYPATLSTMTAPNGTDVLFFGYSLGNNDVCKMSFKNSDVSGTFSIGTVTPTGNYGYARAVAYFNPTQGVWTSKLYFASSNIPSLSGYYDSTSFYNYKFTPSTFNLNTMNYYEDRDAIRTGKGGTSGYHSDISSYNIGFMLGQESGTRLPDEGFGKYSGGTVNFDFSGCPVTKEDFVKSVLNSQYVAINDISYSHGSFFQNNLDFRFWTDKNYSPYLGWNSAENVRRTDGSVQLLFDTSSGGNAVVYRLLEHGSAPSSGYWKFTCFPIDTTIVSNYEEYALIEVGGTVDLNTPSTYDVDGLGLPEQGTLPIPTPSPYLNYVPSPKVLEGVNFRVTFADTHFATIDGVPFTCDGLAPVVHWIIKDSDGEIYYETNQSATAQVSMNFPQDTQSDNTYTLIGKYECLGEEFLYWSEPYNFEINRGGQLVRQDFEQCMSSEFPFINIPACFGVFTSSINILSFGVVPMPLSQEFIQLNDVYNCRPLNVFDDWLGLEDNYRVCKNVPAEIRDAVTPFITLAVTMIVLAFLFRTKANSGDV